MSDGPIAIIGASCRFPGASGLEAFWDLLSTGTDAVSEVDSRRWSTRFFFHPKPGEPGKSYTWSAGLLSGIDLFEPAFFGISPREAAQMDPQQRILLELAWHAIEDAGIPISRFAGTTTGVYVGASTTDYADSRLGDPASGDTYSMTGGTLSIVANRLSYTYDLRGPSLALDTACSSSLVALHHACEALRADRIETAMVGGINLLLTPYPFLGFCRAAMLSRRGRCFAFDERADGYVRGEGGAVILLKPLAKALADRDPIRGVILGTGVNSDGRTIGLSLPSETAQATLLRSVYETAEVDPDDLAFFEMHGTGTQAGDPVEAGAVGAALGQRRRDPLPIGSVKTNIGHLEPASGLAGLLKACLALEHGVAPASLNCEIPNPKIPFDTLNLRLLGTAESIARAERVCAGINSFGFGGTNAHVVLAAAPTRLQAPPVAAMPLPPLLVSARSEAGLRELSRNWRDTLAATPPERAPALLRAAARRRDHHPHRLVAFGTDIAATTAALNEYIDNSRAHAVVTGTAVKDAKLAFVFTGNGAQWAEMGAHPYRRSAAFRRAIAEADALLAPELGWSVAQRIEQGCEPEELARADIAQPLLFAIQVGIVEVLRNLGVEAAGHLGHSVGEIAAAWAAGALSLPTAARVVIARSRNQERTRGKGRMGALALDGTAAQNLIDELNSPLELAALNASHSVTVSGPSESIRELSAEARRRGVAFRALDLDFAFHSRAMDTIRDDLIADLAGLSSQQPPCVLASTVTGGIVSAETLDAEYWWRNIRNPVRFAEAAAKLIEDGFRLFVEIGPNPLLQSYLHDALRHAQVPGRAIPSLSRKLETKDDPFPIVAARCHVAGHDLARAPWFAGPDDPRGLPLHAWQKERFWFEGTVERNPLMDQPFVHPLLGFAQAGAMPAWLNHLDQDLLPWLCDHAIEGVPVLPAAAAIEMALASAQAQRPQAESLELLDVELRRPLTFEKGRMREIRILLAPEDGDWELTSRQRLSGEPFTLHAVARLSSGTEAGTRPPSEQPRGEAREIGHDALYRLAARLGLDYGPRFRTVERIEAYGDNCAVVHLDPSVAAEAGEGYLIHPALLDGALQGMLALVAEHQEALQGASFVPWRFGRVRAIAPFARPPKRAELHLTRVGTRSAAANIALFDEAGEPVAELAECWFRRVELTRRGSIDNRALRVDLVPAPLFELPPAPALDRIGETISRQAAAVLDTTRNRGEQALLLDALIAATCYRAVAAAIGTEAPFTIDELVDAGRIAPDAAMFVAALLPVLEQFGAADASASEWRLTDGNDLPDPTEIWRLLLAEAPDLVGELALVAAAAEALPRVLAEGPRQPDTWVAPLLEHLLQASPASIAGTTLLCDAISEVARNWPQGRALRILEIGAGAATRRILDRLAQAGAAMSYLATTPEPDMAARLSFTVATAVGATARSWSPRDEVDDIDGRRFDLIVAANACARLQLDAAALSRLRERLAPGGLFLAVEPEPNPLWEIVFGSELWSWQGGSPSGEPLGLRSGEEWRTELAVAGFSAPGTAAISPGPWPALALWGKAPPTAEPEPVTEPAAVRYRIALLGVGEDSGWAAALAAVGHQAEVRDAGSLPLATSDTEIPQAFVLVVEGRQDSDVVKEGAERIPALARLAAEAAERHVPLWVVTRGVQQAPDASAGADLVGAALWGFGRVLLNEMPRGSLRLIDVPVAYSIEEAAQRLAAELAADSPEREIVWTPLGRHVLRLRRGLPPRWAAPSDLLALSTEQPGALDALAWKPRPAGTVGPGEVEIDVGAAGLNFRDVMWAMGLLPEEALIDGFAGPTFGLECAGVVSAVGPDVEGLSVGDRVAGFAPAALSSRVVTMADAVVRLPEEIGFAAAATVPVTFVTAIYALGTLAQVAPGEHVLIHAAAGGVGLAAIQYAKHRGAAVIATAGSEGKRAFLRLAGADHVLDSRDLSFPDAVRALTAGQGVDVVLNSLSGEAMEQSLAVLKPFGRFLELGKRDFYMNRRIHLRPLRQNISYFAIDVDQLPIRRPEVARSLLTEVSAALATGAIRPLAHRTFSFAHADDAFRLMQGSGHIGKLVLVPDGNAGIRSRQAPPLGLRRDGTYLVTGGVSGFGFEAARWLAAQGAGSIALLGRRGAETPGAAERVVELQKSGIEVRVYTGDVADAASLSTVLAAIRENQPPLRGVVHAAATIGDALASEIDASNAVPILEAKLGGAVLLDRLTRDDPIELFVLFSSATTLLGAPGQGVYVAANLAVEALARRRRAEGRPALAIAWGPIEDAGYLAERRDTREALSRRLGAKPIAAMQALSALPDIIASGLASAAFAETSWNEARRFLPILAAPLFDEVRADAGTSATDDSLIERLSGLSTEEATAVLKTVVAEEIATIMRLPAGSIDPLRPLSEMGMDSLMAVELRLAIESRLRVDLPLMSLAEGTSVASIAARLAVAVSARPEAPDLVGMAERYESADAVQAVEEMTAPVEPVLDPKSAAAE